MLQLPTKSHPLIITPGWSARSHHIQDMKRHRHSCMRFSYSYFSSRKLYTVIPAARAAPTAKANRAESAPSHTDAGTLTGIIHPPTVI